MNSSATIRTGEQSSALHIVKNPSSKKKTIGFAIAIILGLGGLAVAGVGLGGYLQAGSLSSLGQINSIIMMAAGCGGGIVFLRIGIVGCAKNRQKSSNRWNESTEGNTKAKASSKPQKDKSIVSTLDTQGGLVYRKDAWKFWRVEVLDDVSDAPEIPWDNNDPYFNEPFGKNYVLLYIPEKIRVNSEEKELTLKTFKEISGGPFEEFDRSVKEQFGDSTAAGWLLISKKVIPESRNKDYEAQKKMIEDKGFYMPYTLEAIVLNLMMEAFTGVEALTGETPGFSKSLTYTRCVEKVSSQYPVNVGWFCAGLDVQICNAVDNQRGVCAVLRGEAINNWMLDV